MKDNSRLMAPLLPLKKIAPAGIAILLYIFMTTLYLLGQTQFIHWILTCWGFTPNDFLFLDTETIFSALRCRHMGIDVSLTNPCDPLGRQFDYPPVWLAVSILPVKQAWTTIAGFIFDLMFLASLFLLPAGRTWLDTAVITLAVLSTPAAFALERGNSDLVIFSLSACTARLVSRSDHLRFFAYFLALLAGLLKYYPISLLALAARERVLPFLLTVGLSGLVVCCLVAVWRADLARALAAIPPNGLYYDAFGALNLPLGIVHLSAPSNTPDWAVDAIRVALTTLTVAAGAIRGLELGKTKRCGGTDGGRTKFSARGIHLGRRQLYGGSKCLLSGN